jgi:hypothetical protein
MFITHRSMQDNGSCLTLGCFGIWMLINLILLGRFIQTYGTHMIVGMAVGGQDLLCVKQKPSSPIPPADLRRYLEDLGDFLFSDQRSPSLLQRKTRDGKQKVLCFILLFDVVIHQMYMINEVI